MVDAWLRCTGTLVEHVLGPVECTDDDCTAAPEAHWLTVRCVEVSCRCVHDVSEAPTDDR